MARPPKEPARPPRVKWFTAKETAQIIGKSTEWLRLKRNAGEVYAELLDNGRWGYPDFEVERLRLRTPPRLIQPQR